MTRCKSTPAVAEDHYDPSKPEYTMPASEDEVEQILAKLRAQQAARLEKAVRKRMSLPGATDSSAMLEHYHKMVEHLRPTHKRQCPVCLDNACRPHVILMTLSCGHELCRSCGEKCASTGLSSCPICRHPHLLDAKNLSARAEKWRAQYTKWRQGQAGGAKGEQSSICAPIRPLENQLPAALSGALDEWVGDKDFDAWVARTAAHGTVTSSQAGDIILARRPKSLSEAFFEAANSHSGSPKAQTGSMKCTPDAATSSANDNFISKKWLFFGVCGVFIAKFLSARSVRVHLPRLIS